MLCRGPSRDGERRRPAGTRAASPATGDHCPVAITIVHFGWIVIGIVSACALTATISCSMLCAGTVGLRLPLRAFRRISSLVSILQDRKCFGFLCCQSGISKGICSPFPLCIFRRIQLGVWSGVALYCLYSQLLLENLSVSAQLLIVCNFGRESLTVLYCTHGWMVTLWDCSSFQPKKYAFVSKWKVHIDLL